MKLRKIIISLSFLFIAIISGLFACSSENQKETLKEQSYKGVGVIKAVNSETGEITIDHEKIEGLMSAMTMDFPAADKKLLESAKVGDKIEFELRQKESEIALININKIGEFAQLDGTEIFKTNCAKCHGANGEGTEKGISFLKGHALHHSAEEFIRQVENGEEGEMPAFKDKLSKEEIAAVVKYVREEIQKGKTEKSEDKSHKH